MTEQDFFHQLLKETEKVFLTSPIYKYQKEHNKNWNFAVCDTPIKKGKGLVFGLNWGGDDKDAQTVYPPEKRERKWNFMGSSKKYFKSYLNIEAIDDINYSNLCFFRSSNLKPLVAADWKASLPLFQKYVAFIEPEWTVMLGNTGVKILQDNALLTDLVKVKFERKRGLSYGYKAKLFGKYPLYCVPHPQAQISSEVRKGLWEKMFEGR